MLLFITTCCYIGYLPGAPGTYASIAACLIMYALPFFSMSGSVGFACTLIVCSVLSVNALKYDGEDPSYIVIDELAGMFVALAGHGPTFVNLISGFLLFRFFDIIKPYPIRLTERLKGGYGVVADDVLAGIFANIGIWLGHIVMEALQGAQSV